MKYPSWEISEGYQETPILKWIRYRRGEPIPDDMKFDGWVISKEYYEKLIDYWIKYRPDESVPDLQCEFSSESSSDESSY